MIINVLCFYGCDWTITVHLFKRQAIIKTANQNPFSTSVTLTGSSGWRPPGVNNEIKEPFGNPLSWCHNSESPELPERTGKEEGPQTDRTAVSPNNVLWALWHWMTLPWRRPGGGKVAIREERCLSEHRYSLRLSLLSHPPNHCRDLSWVSLRLDPEQVCFHGPCVCVSPKRLSLSALLLTASISPSLLLCQWQGGKS